jgi:type I restriction enzyme S subunit
MINEYDTVVVADGSRSGLPIRGVHGALGSTLLRYRAKDNYDPDFLFYLLESFYPYTNTTTIGGAVPHLDKRLLAKLQIYIPSQNERQLIGKLLSVVDQAISFANTEVNSARRLKTASMQQLFTKGIPGKHDHTKTAIIFRKRIDIPFDWEHSRLSSNVTLVQYGTNAPSNDTRRGYPVIAIPQVISPRLVLGNVPYAHLPEVEAQALRLVEDDVLLIRTNGNPHFMGKSTIVTKDVASRYVVFASYLIRIRTNKERLLGAYFNYFLASPLGRQQALAMANTSAGNHNLGARSLKQFWIPRPDIAEQEKIVELINGCDDTIDALDSKLSSLYLLKKSLLQNLLTGKVRIKPEGIK